MKLAIAGATGAVGRYVTLATEQRGHEVVPLSRSHGVDLVRGTDLARTLDGVDAVIDTASVQTTSAAVSREFFETVTGNLLSAERTAGVRHHVALSICGIDGVDAAYYAGKLAQERAVQSGDVPWSILRAAQFHEFAEQVLTQVPKGPITLVPKMLVRPVAAREVGAALVRIAEGDATRATANLAGPRDERMIDMVRRMRRHDRVRGPLLEVRLPGAFWAACASGQLRGPADAERGTTTFDEWLTSGDH